VNRIWIYESELRAIAQETLSWKSETGGDLFGKWGSEPTIFLATRLGPQSRRSQSQCQFDLHFLEQISTAMAVDWGLQFLGDWHSHYRSGVTHPSRIDRNRIGRLIERNGFERVLEFIATIVTPESEAIQKTQVHGYIFPKAHWYSPDLLEIGLIPGVSPLREILTLRDAPLAQDWNAWQQVSTDQVSGWVTTVQPPVELVHSYRDSFARRAILHLIFQLETTFQIPVVDAISDNGRDFSMQIADTDIRLRFSETWPFPIVSVQARSGSETSSFDPDQEFVTAFQCDRVVAVIRSLIGRVHHTDELPPLSV